ncbi:MAG: hypothetical protein ACRDY7_10230 [Acidimicrobiia bacterium]
MSAGPVGAPDAPGAASEATMRLLLRALGVSQVALGLFMAAVPGVFADTIGGFGTRNDHLTRDGATFYLALGAGLVLAATRRSWRVPLLAVATVDFALHVLNHVVDIADAEPAWVGPFDAAVLAAELGLLVWLWLEATRAGDPGR